MHNQWKAIIYFYNLQFNTLDANDSNKLLFTVGDAVTYFVCDYGGTQNNNNKNNKKKTGHFYDILFEKEFT